MSRAAFPVALAAAIACAALAACRQDMHDQHKLKRLAESPFFADGRGSRAPVDGTVARGHLHADRHMYEGLTDAGELVDSFPMPVTNEVLARGRERYDIFCSPCHSRTGRGDGMVVRRGFKAPPTFHKDELRTAKLGHFFEVVTKGFGVMPSYAVQIPAEDRWAIIAYVRALQLSEDARIDDVPAADRAALLAEKGAAP